MSKQINDTRSTTTPKGIDEKLYKRLYFDNRKKGNTTLDYFTHDDFKYGDGLKVITAGHVISKDLNKQGNPVDFPAIQPEYFIDTTNDKVMKKTEIRVDKTEYEKYQSAEDAAKFIALQMRTLDAKNNLVRNKLFEDIFGTQLVDRDSIFTDNEKALADKLRDKVSKIREHAFNGDALKALLEIKKVSYDLEQQSKENPMDTTQEIYQTTPLEDQVLIIGYEDYIDIKTATSDKYRVDDLSLPNFGKVIVIPNGVKGTFYLIDKNALRNYDYFNGFYEVWLPEVVQYQLILHTWYLLGLITIYGGRKFTWTRP